MCYAIGGYTMTEDGQYIDEFIWGFEGDVTPDQITWDYLLPATVITCSMAITTTS